MKEWLTARELAQENLPDLPTNTTAMIRYAAREGWNACLPWCRTRKGRGGGLEYNIRILPTLARLDYERRHRKIVAAPQPAAPALVLGTGLTDRAARERDARLAIIRAFEGFGDANRLTTASRIQIFTDRYNCGSQAVEAWVRELVPHISRRTLQRWLSAKFVGRVDRLAVDRAAARKGKGLLETANGGKVETFILAWLATSPHLSAQVIRGYVEEEFGPELVDAAGEVKPLPPVRTFQHVLSKLRAEKKVVLTKLSNPDAYRSTLKLRGTGAYNWVNEPNQLWMIDASPVDALCVNGRWTLYAAVDVATRRLKITLSRTPRASAVCLMLRKAMLAWGVPRQIKTDNGSDFAAEETLRLLRALEIDPDPSDAYCPDQKGHVERVIKTFQHEVGPQLPGYIGHNVADRKSIEERRSFAERLGSDDTKTFSVSLTAAQLQQHIDDWLEYVYERREHGGTGLSPAAKAAASTTPIARVDERALDVLLMPVADKGGRRRMTAQGIKIGGHYYLSHAILVGTDVFVRMDPIDMGKIYVFSAEDGRYLDKAECPALLDVDRPAFVAAKKELYEGMVSQATRQIRQEKRRILKGPSGIERTIALAKRKAAEEAGQAANVVALPKREVAHETPAIRAALEVGRPVERRPLSAEETAELAALQAAFAAGLAAPGIRMFPGSDLQNGSRQQSAPATAEVKAFPDRPKVRFLRALELERLREAGGTLNPADAQFLTGYQVSAEYQSFQDLYRDFGDEWLSA